MARILLIEDNPANLELMNYLLKAFGHTTFTALDGEEGIAQAAKQMPDLILCDVHLPRMDGYQVADHLRGRPELHAIPRVAVTALAMVGDRDKVLAAGFDGYIAKPIDPENFVGQVEAFLQSNLRGASSPALHDAKGGAGKLPHAKGRTILVVDNEQVNLDMASSLLKYSGYEVVTTPDATEALKLARRAPPDLIMSDVRMPFGSGFDFIRQVKSDPRLKSIPFIFVTSTALDEDDRRKGLALGAVKYLFRPLEPQALLNEIESCFEE